MRVRGNARTRQAWTRFAEQPPAQRDLFLKRHRRPPAIDPDEREMQIAVVKQVRLRCRAGVTCWHTPNQAARADKRFAALLQAMGVLPGVADLQFMFPPIVNATHGTSITAPMLFLELKARGESLSEAQKTFRLCVRRSGHRYEWADSIDDALRILKLHKVIK